MKTIAETAEDIRAIGQVVAELSEPGDLVMLNGPLGAGKTTMTQGIALGLGVPEQISSPTFVIAQIYTGSRMELVHVDAYRLESMDELDALDLDASLEEALTVVEWGAGKVEALTGERLEIEIERPTGGDDYTATDTPRVLTFHGVGERGEKFADDVAARLGLTEEN